MYLWGRMEKTNSRHSAKASYCLHIGACALKWCSLCGRKLLCKQVYGYVLVCAYLYVWSSYAKVCVCTKKYINPPIRSHKSPLWCSLLYIVLYCCYYYAYACMFVYIFTVCQHFCALLTLLFYQLPFSCCFLYFSSDWLCIWCGFVASLHIHIQTNTIYNFLNIHIKVCIECIYI